MKDKESMNNGIFAAFYMVFEHWITISPKLKIFRYK